MHSSIILICIVFFGFVYLLRNRSERFTPPITGVGVGVGFGSGRRHVNSNVTKCVDRYGDFVSGLYNKREKKRACRWFSRKCNRQSRCRDEINELATTDDNPNPFEQLKTECSNRPLKAWETCT